MWPAKEFKLAKFWDAIRTPRPGLEPTLRLDSREAAGMMPHVPVMRTVNNQGDGSLFGRLDFRYEPDTDSPR